MPGLNFVKQKLKKSHDFVIWGQKLEKLRFIRFCRSIKSEEAGNSLSEGKRCNMILKHSIYLQIDCLIFYN